METNIQNALILLAIGMVTVFTILGMVMATGRTLIWAVNNMSEKKVTSVQQKKIVKKSEEDEMELIVQEVVKRITAGKGTIKSIKKNP